MNILEFKKLCLQKQKYKYYFISNLKALRGATFDVDISSNLLTALHKSLNINEEIKADLHVHVDETIQTVFVSGSQTDLQLAVKLLSLLNIVPEIINIDTELINKISLLQAVNMNLTEINQYFNIEDLKASLLTTLRRILDLSGINIDINSTMDVLNAKERNLESNELHIDWDQKFDLINALNTKATSEDVHIIFNDVEMALITAVYTKLNMHSNIHFYSSEVDLIRAAYTSFRILDINTICRGNWILLTSLYTKYFDVINTGAAILPDIITPEAFAAYLAESVAAATAVFVELSSLPFAVRENMTTQHIGRIMINLVSEAFLALLETDINTDGHMILVRRAILQDYDNNNLEDIDNTKLEMLNYYEII